MTRARAREQLAVAAATLGLAAVLYPGALLRGEAFFERDLHLDWYARMAAIGRALAQGSWPLWEPGLGFGQPLLADPSAQVLYPVTWLVLLLPWGAAYTGFVLVHLVIAAVGTFRLALRLGAGRAGAWTAALAFVLSGPVQSALNLWHHFSGIAWMPWVLLATDTLVRRPGARSCLALAGALALQVLAGSADLSAMTLACAACLAVLRLAERRRRIAWRCVLGWAGAACALAAALTCALWWPAAEMVSRSARSGLAQDVRGAWSIPAAGLARLLVPLDPDRVAFEPGLWTRLYDRPVHPFLFSAYLGLPVVGLLVASLAASARRVRALALALLTLAAVAYATGPHGPLYGPLSAALPPLRIFRYPSKALWVASLAAALGAGLGVRALARLAPRRRIALAGFLALAAAAAALTAARIRAEPSWAPALCAALALLLALPRRGVQPRLAGAAAALVALADLAAAHMSLNATVPARLLVEPPALVDRLRTEDGRRVHIWDYQILPGTSERLLGRSDPYRVASAPAGVDRRVLNFAAQRQFLVPPTATFFGIETSYDLDNRGLFPRDMDDLCHFLRYVEGTSVHTTLLRMGAVEKLVALHLQGLEDLRVVATLPSLMGEEMRVLAVDGAQPRAWLVGRTRRADGVAALRELAQPWFDPRDEAVVATGEPLAGAPGFEGRVRWLDRRSDRQRLETTSARPALLVQADAYDPGWQARVDGAPATVVRTNVAFRGMALGAGRHVVELVYRPRSVVWGASVSLAALLASAGLFIGGARSRRLARRASG